MHTLLRGPRVSLRPVERDHLGQLQAWFSQYDLARMVNPKTIRLPNMDGETAWFEGIQADGSHTFAIYVDEPAKTEAVLAGTCGLHHLDHKNRQAILGIAIADPGRRGQGLGTEAMKLLLEWGFLELNLHRIELYVFEYNPRAKALYERLGFKLEGTLRQSIFREGRYWDQSLMAMLRPEYHPDPRWGLPEAPGGTPA